MLFVESRFFLFFLIVFCVYWSLRNNNWRKGWLLAASYFFYGCFDWRFLFLLAGSTTMDFVLGLLMTKWSDPGRRKALVVTSVTANLALLATFKYFNFFILSASGFLSWIGLPASMSTLNIILPVGLSFYTFQSMSYTIDIYRGRLEAVRKPLDLYFFVSFFPQLVAGPIVRAMTFLPQVTTCRRFANVDVRGALVLFLCGFVKKACVSDNIAPFVDHYFSGPQHYTAFSAWIAVLFYAVQIYCDFSGYTDMAIASARLLGYDLTINFNFPYFAQNPTDFWRRWHISLSTWLRDYLYISLGGNRGSKWFTYRNLMLTMLLGGLWHGSRWTFVIWGFLHGLALIAHREWVRLKIWFFGSKHDPASPRSIPDQSTRPGRWSWFTVPFSVVCTFYFTCVMWIFFRAADLSQPMSNMDFSRAMTALRSFVLFHDKGPETLDHRLLWIFVGLAILHWLNFKKIFHTWWRKCPDLCFAAGFGAAIAVVVLFIPQHYAPFIYFQF